MKNVVLGELKKSILSNKPIVYLFTLEHRRVIKKSKEMIDDELNIKNIYYWDNSNGLHNEKGEILVNSKEGIKGAIEYLKETLDHRAILFAKDMHLNFEKKEELVALQLFGEKVLEDGLPINIIAVCGSKIIPSEIDKICHLIEFPLPDREDIENLIDNIMTKNRIYLDRYTKMQFIESLNGLSEDEIITLIGATISNAYSEKRPIGKEDILNIIMQKKQIINKSGIVEIVIPEFSLKDVGGLRNLRKWIKDREVLFKDPEKAREYGLNPPKGILLFGLPGSGKSLVSKVIAAEYRIPLLRVDMGIIFGHKSPEEAISKATTLADTISPCVFWIDEVDKALAGSSTTEDSGSEEIARITGHLLTWMQERKSRVFVIATANDITKVNVAFYRDGRVSERFFVGFLNNKSDVKEIIELHLKKRLKDKYSEIVKPLDYDAIFKKIQQMVARYKGEEYAGYSGANIEALVEKVLEQRFFRKKRYVTTKDFIQTLNYVKPQHGEGIRDLIRKAEEIDAINA